jgi:nitroreductase
MEKRAAADHPIAEFIVHRWSPRAFVDRPIEPAALASIFEAARWAASSYNEQPWRFIYAAKPDLAEFERLLGCLASTNQMWARNAGVLIFPVARLTFSSGSLAGQPNRHALHDVGLATANLIYQAMALGLFAHPMAGFSPEKLRELCAIPEGYEPVTAVAVGYPGDPESLPTALKEREVAPRVRRPLDEVVLGSRWR